MTAEHPSPTVMAEAAAVSAREIAEAAARAARERQAELDRQREAARRAEEDRLTRIGFDLIEDSPLADWFPGVEWQWADLPGTADRPYGRYVITPKWEPGAFYLLLTRSIGHLGVRIEEEADRDLPVAVAWATRGGEPGYPSWSATPVKSLVNIGELLLQRREHPERR